MLLEAKKVKIKVVEIGKVITTEITKELSKSYLDYAMSVIVARALPDIKDGLKPVHRRILYAMYLMGLIPGKPYSKSAKVVGEVLGKYHPHGDSPVYEALVRLAQNFSMRYPLVDGHGNFGSVDGDPAAAMRYTETRLTKISLSMLNDLEKDTVEFVPNFDATLKEPSYLPSLLPNLLLMGSEGIAVGMATKIPPHNLGEICHAIIATIKKGKAVVKDGQETSQDFFIKKIDLVASGEQSQIKDEDLSSASDYSFESEIELDELLKYVAGPDFPTGGAIYEASSLEEVYSTGRGRIKIRGIAQIKEGSRGKSIIEITELPYQVNKAQLVQKIADLARDKKIKGIATVRDESDKTGMSVVVELKKDGKPKSVLNNLYKHTKLQTTFPANFVALIAGVPQTVNLKQIITEFVKHRQKVVVRRTIFDLTAAKRRAHILEGLKIALDNLDNVISTIRKSRTQEDAKTNLIKKFSLTDIQATAILDTQLRRLAALEREKIEKEYEEVKKLIDRLTAILKSPQKVLEIIVKELSELMTNFADERRTKIYKQSLGQFSEEDLVPKKKMLITVTKTGYIKMVPTNTYKSQRRGGKGVIGMTTKEEDEIEHLLSATTHDTILFFTDRGRVFSLRAWELPETSRQSKGHAIINLLNLEQGENVLSLVSTNKKADTGNLVLATKKGLIKKTKMSKFENLRSNGLIAIKLRQGDQLVGVKTTSENDHFMLITKAGKAIRFSESDVRPMGRATSGVRGIKTNEGDEVVALEVFAEKQKVPRDKRKKVFRDILTLSKKGIGKRTRVDLFPLQKRAGKGVKAAVVNSKTGPLAGVRLVNQKMGQVVITSANGQIIKLPLKNIPQMGRSTQGVILMRFADKEDRVAALTMLEKSDEK